MYTKEKFYCLRQGTSKRGRQSANQSGMQAVSQAVSRASRQAGRQAETHSLAFFQLRTTITNIGEPLVCTNTQWLSASRVFCGARRPSAHPKCAGAGGAHRVPALRAQRFAEESKHLHRMAPQAMSVCVRGRGIVLSGKIMIPQGVGHPISCLGVCYANDPPKGGCMASVPAVDLTTSLRGDSPPG